MNYLLAKIGLDDFTQTVQRLREAGYVFTTDGIVNFSGPDGTNTGDWFCARFAGPLPEATLFDPPGVEYRPTETGWLVSQGEPALPREWLDGLLAYFRTLEVNRP